VSGRATLIYDGECSLCVVAAAWLDRRLPSRDDVDVVAAQQWLATTRDVVAAQQWLATTRGVSVVSADETARAAWWVEDGRRLEGSRAVARALIALGGGWRLVGRILASRPVDWVAAPVYRFVARHRPAARRRRRPVSWWDRASRFRGARTRIG
jgi:predicted DCC family thiol-disulfide oxidoreductase YuxK